MSVFNKKIVRFPKEETDFFVVLKDKTVVEVFENRRKFFEQHTNLQNVPLACSGGFERAFWLNYPQQLLLLQRFFQLGS